jgi:phosphoserine phosphatase RsbU/P
MNRILRFTRSLRSRKTTSIFRQLIYNVIIPALIAFTFLGVVNYYQTRNILLDASRKTDESITSEITYILKFQDVALELLEEGYDRKLSEKSEKIVNYYLKNTKNIETANLQQIQRELGMDPKLEDIYIIDRNGIIVNTTFEKDRNLNLFNFGESHKKFLLHVFEGKKFSCERFAIESSTRRLKKYSYQPTLDGKYLVEVGIYSSKADEITSSIKDRVASLTSKEETLKSVDLFIVADEPFSLDLKTRLIPSHRPLLLESVNKKTTVTCREKENGSTLNYSYIFMDRKNSVLYKGAVIRIVKDYASVDATIRTQVLKLVGMFSLAMFIVSILLYRKTRVITMPIKNLVDSVNRITHGHLDERVQIHGNNEITTLSKQFNRMIEELESYYTELEEKVRQRTAEIQQQKEEIETQRDAIEQQNEILSQTNQNLEIAYKEIEEQKKHIMDSIHYARRIQTAILPPDEVMKRMFPEMFILYKPKDIVSGDFYWVSEKDNDLLIAAVDCTGHGVPGAFMSIVGHNQLNFAVNVMDARKPSDILDYLNAGVTSELKQQRNVSSIRDGMDLALCSVNYDTMKLQYAGANNPMLFIRNNELTVYTSDKMPIGQYYGEEIKPFTNNEIDMQKGDMFYIFSDGYVDQFGGPDNRKFMIKRFKEMLLEICNNPMETQREIVLERIEEWKGNHIQIDDILVIGVKI